MSEMFSSINLSYLQKNTARGPYRSYGSNEVRGKVTILNLKAHYLKINEVTNPQNCKAVIDRALWEQLWRE